MNSLVKFDQNWNITNEKLEQFITWVNMFRSCDEQLVYPGHFYPI